MSTTDSTVNSLVARSRSGYSRWFRSKRGILARVAGVLFDVAVLAVAAVVLCSRFGRQGWLFDMLTFFTPWILLLALALLAVAVASRTMLRTVVGLVIAAGAAWPILSTLWLMAPSSDRSDLSVMVANVMVDNTDYQRFRSLVAASDPDIVVAAEAMAHWWPTVTSLAGLRYSTGPEYFGSLLVASRFPIHVTELQPEDPASPKPEIPGSKPLKIVVDRPGALRPLVIFAVHPPTPLSLRGWKSRNTSMLQVARAAAVAAETSDVVLAGDWNMPTWSPFFADVLKTGHLLTAERSLLPWPTRILYKLGDCGCIGSPIDHVAVSRSVSVRSFDVGPEFGSDHRAVVARLRLSQ